jgi:molybdopterin-biosynthesis enzyme MoeA-like protein
MGVGGGTFFNRADCCGPQSDNGCVVLVLQAVIVPDDVSAIASEVAALSASCQAVITSGGVGPTLDDVTMEGIAAAFGVDLIR